MITEIHSNGAIMRLQAICSWGMTCDVTILQEWNIPNREIWVEEIQLTSDQAEKLIKEINSAIITARQIDKEYADSMKELDNENISRQE